MIEKIFFSDNNKNILNKIINDDIKNNSNKNKNQNIINKNMKYVLSNISKTPPKNMDVKDYLFLMNKKVYDLSIKEINSSNINSKSNVSPSSNINSNYNSNINSSYNNSNTVLNESKRIDNNVFDSQLLSQYQNVAPVIDYPKPGNSSTENSLLSNKVEEIQKERETIYPKQQEINFQDDKDDSNNTMDLYNDLLSSYNQQLTIGN